jgi:hexosaminidase
MRLAINLFFILSTGLVSAQNAEIIPKPVDIQKHTGSFTISFKTVIIADDSADKQSALFLIDYVKSIYGIRIPIVERAASGYIHINKKKSTYKSNRDGYTLLVEKNKIELEGETNAGTFFGIQTIIQLISIPDKSNKIPQRHTFLDLPCLYITDYPRFAYRGLHFDVSRHFFPVDYIKKYIDYIALHKMNYFHWHLTDDQGWRIEIKKYPKLTSVGAWRDGTIIGRYPGTGNDHIHYGGFYTQEQIKEVVKYAADRYITVIPEIEMPGHSMAALAAYPQLGTTPDSVYKVAQTWGINDVYNNVLNPSEYTFNFLQDVLDEVMPLFPAPYIHIGGDECSKRWWHESAFCQQLMKEKGIKDEDGLQSYFIQRMEKYINSKGRKIIGWDEILEGGLAQNATVMSWRGEEGGIAAAKQNHDVIMTPGNPVYFDHTQSQNEDSVTIGGYNPIEKVYAYEPIPKELNEEQSKHVLGAQANMWTEYMGNTRKVEYMLFPRLSALSEVLWSQKENRDWKDFQKRLMGQFKRYDLWKVNYSKAYFDLKSTVTPTVDFNGINWDISNGYTKGSLTFRVFEQFTGIDTQVLYTASHPSNFLKYQIHNSPWWRIHAESFTSSARFLITKEGQYSVTNYKFTPESESDNIYLDSNYPIITLNQSFTFNEATGKKITLTNPASEKYPGDGPFTLVNGVINEKGFARSREFLGFNGINCEAVIDLGILEPISFVVVNTLNRTSSWIWRPLTAEVLGSGDGKNWYSLKMTDDFEEKKDGTGKGTMTMAFKATYARYVKVVITNWGTIPAGNPGAGNKPWLFVDEIEVN